METLVDQLMQVLRGIWRFRWYSLITAWVVFLVGSVAILAIPNSYQAQARVYIDARTPLRPLLEGIAVETDVASQIDYVRQVLLSGPQLAKVAAETDLALGATSAGELQALVEELQNSIKIEAAASRGRGVQNSLYTISYEHTEPRKARDVVKNLLDAFVEDTLGSKRTGTETAQRFLREQIADYEARLQAAEQRLADFRRRNVGVVPGAEGGYFARLQTETTELNRVRTALGVAMKRRDELQRQLRGEQIAAASATAGSASAPATETGLRLAETNARLAQLQLRFTDRHPEVIALQETQRQLIERQQQEIEALRQGRPPAAGLPGLSTSPVYQTIQMQLNQAEVDIASLRGEVADREARVSMLERQMNVAPEVEAELARLNRDYGVTQEQYQALVRRLESARLSEDADETGVVRFDVIDPPTVGAQPVSPDRPRLLLALCAAAVLIGAGVGYLLQQIRPVYEHPSEVGSSLGLPVLGVVTLNLSEARLLELRRQNLVFSAAAAVLALAFVLTLSLQSHGAAFVRKLLF
ncbi:MAG: hypothetical protein O9284_17235 [Steroidobacteraceae bacterium]|nr:hypothetical protein [Steroidobacteraceae bacterium]